MTNESVIEKLECCLANAKGKRCSLANESNCFETTIRESIDLINRQKAEIERLRYNLKAVLDERADHTDAINECIARFEKKIKDVKFTIGQTWEIQSALKEVEKEMVGDANEG